MNEAKEQFLSFLLNAIYSIQKTSVTQNKVAFISTKGNEVPKEFLEIQKILESKKSKKFKFQLVNICENLCGDNASFGKRTAHLFKCMHYLPSCRVAVYDDANCSAMSLLIHKNSLTKINLSNGLEQNGSYFKDGSENVIYLENLNTEEGGESTLNAAQIVANIISGELGS